MVENAAMERSKLKNNAPPPISFGGIAITVVVVAIAIFSTHTLFLILFGMLPGFIASIVDRYLSRDLTKIVILFNFSGISPYLVQILFHTDQVQEIAIKLILTPHTWLYIYTFSAVGWIVYRSFPNISLLIKNITIQLRINELTNELEKLTDEWGNEVRRTPEE